MDIPKLLQKVGNKGRYQLILLIYMSLVLIQSGYILFGASYLFMNPIFKCKDIVAIVQQNVACPIQDQCILQNDFTITASMHLFCAKKFQRNFIQSALYIGSLIGTIIMNIVSDRHGRKFAFMISAWISLIGAILITIGAYEKVVALLILGEAFLGFGGYAILTISYIIRTDLMEDSYMQKSIMIANTLWGVGLIIYFVIYKWLNNWQYFLIAFTISPLALLIIIGHIFLVESPCFLITFSKQKCLISLNKIARWNKTKELNEDDIQQIQVDSIKELETREQSFLAFFAKWEYLKTVIIQSIFLMSINMFYYGTQFSLQVIGLDFGFNMLIIGVLQIVVYSTSIYFITKMRRKKSLLFLNAVAALLGLAFFIPYVRNQIVLQSVILGLTRFFIAYSQGILAVFMIESFPDSVKSRGYGIIYAFGIVANIIVPYILTVISNAGINPMIFFSIILLLGLPPLIFTKETLNLQILSTDSQYSKI